MEVFDRHKWRVATTTLRIGAALVDRWHYAKGASNTATYLHGLFRSGDPRECYGVAWWIPPTKTAAQSITPMWEGVLSLSRLVCSDVVPKNGESFLIGHSMRMIDRKRWPVLVTYADEWQGHTGAIYKATGWTESGKTVPERRYVNESGCLVARKAGPYTRTHDEMLSLGCKCIGSFSAIRFIHRANG